eukprot:CAMPEP_0181202298 /NCGR_PEP_ID=MMETSP1096-20121128/18765_1 /TAXON_ID=156174 ORGANISM="Chrysochromulina ericina, Strain CCMP281" /NCGR_SAMPLE_ID=MMETSP1096 /ASSEMBLY_ACC=CAM_ASM_000453 /LENGTH=131 /DNA_ID=CAMNT_0023292797 /DNA_START=238 /DNA_END=634 /DNA_ORIENTATION=+
MASMALACGALAQPQVPSVVGVPSHGRGHQSQDPLGVPSLPHDDAHVLADAQLSQIIALLSMLSMGVAKPLATTCLPLAHKDKSGSSTVLTALNGAIGASSSCSRAPTPSSSVEAHSGRIWGSLCTTEYAT